MSTRDAERRELRFAGTWIGLVLVAILTVAIVGVFDWLVLWGHSSTCHEAPDPHERGPGGSGSAGWSWSRRRHGCSVR
jgi:hypothetical protein